MSGPERARTCTPRDRALASVDATAKNHGVTVRAIMSRSMRRRVVSARIDAMQRLAEDTGWSLRHLATFFGRHHTTVLNALQKTKARG